VKTDIQIPKGGNRYPTLTLSWDEQAWGFTVEDCARKLSEGDPRIEVLTKNNPSLVPAVDEGNPERKEPKTNDQLQIVSMTLRPSEDVIVGRRLRGILSAARKAARPAA
jgi:L-seryl-tRNA(Ser) seleniumtransferase